MKTIQWAVETSQHNKNHFLLWCRVNEGEWWAIFGWDHKPTEAEIKATTNMFYRAFLFYHNQITIPDFGNPEVEIKMEGRLL